MGRVRLIGGSGLVRRVGLVGIERVWVVIALITSARIVYQIFFSPYELVADEAQYWDWSRRLSASYYSKGPGIAWLIAASTSLAGVSAWAIRIPAALSFAMTALIVARLAAEWSLSTATAAHAATIAVLLVNLIPAYQLAAILMTIDAPYIACWALAVWYAWRAYVREREGVPSWGASIALGFAIGLGFLFKYTMVLLVPGLTVLWVLERTRLDRHVWQRASVAALVAAVIALPVVIWNLQHDAAGVRHLLGHLSIAGGDQTTGKTVVYQPLWTLAFLGSQLGVIGPALAGMALAASWIGRRADVRRFALCCAAPTLIAFLLVTVRTPAEGNWPIAAYVSLLPLVACTVAESATRADRVVWRGVLGYGVMALVAIHAPLATARLPIVGRYVPTIRFTGFAERARQFAIPLAGARRDRDDTILIAPSHNAAALFAFYLPGRPLIASAGRYLGDRPSAYDYFPDTSLDAEALRGRRVVFLGATEDAWQRAFIVDDLELLSPWGPEFAASRYWGPRTLTNDHAGARDHAVARDFSPASAPSRAVAQDSSPAADPPAIVDRR